jgi:hypothetical protein
LLNEDDNGTDLGTLEKRLAEKEKDRSRRTSAAPGSNPTSPQGNLGTSTQDGSGSSPRSRITSPEPHDPEGDKRNESQNNQEVEALSDMMCSLVTNNCGETRYIGIQRVTILKLQCSDME